jgi:hypothetical protein
MVERNVPQKSVREGLITALAVGGTFILLGSIIVSTPDFGINLQAFFNDITFVFHPFGSGTIGLPVPQNPNIHLSLFTAALYFAVGIAVLQCIVLPIRIWFKSRRSKITETVGNLVFWVGTAIVANSFLLTGTRNGWFQFWAFSIILGGISLLVRGIVQFIKKP